MEKSKLTTQKRKSKKTVYNVGFGTDQYIIGGSHMKCEACKNTRGRCTLELDKTKYIICLNCLTHLTNLNLSRTEFKNLLKSGHSTEEFFLHDKFYDKKGKALHTSAEIKKGA